MKIKIIEPCIVKGESLRTGDYLESPSQITDADARYLIGIGRAEAVEAAEVETKTKTKAKAKPAVK